MINPLLKIGYFNLAKNVSRYSDHRHKIGCVIVNHKPLAVGWNINKTSPRVANPEISKRKSVHAEARAIKNSGREKMKNGTAYIYRETVGHKPAMARPCEHCMGLLKEFGVRKILYTTDSFPYFEMEKI